LASAIIATSTPQPTPQYGQVVLTKEGALHFSFTDMGRLEDIN
jgi:hypothetical protein